MINLDKRFHESPVMTMYRQRVSEALEAEGLSLDQVRTTRILSPDQCRKLNKAYLRLNNFWHSRENFHAITGKHLHYRS